VNIALRIECYRGRVIREDRLEVGNVRRYEKEKVPTICKLKLGGILLLPCLHIPPLFEAYHPIVVCIDFREELIQLSAWYEQACGAKC